MKKYKKHIAILMAALLFLSVLTPTYTYFESQARLKNASAFAKEVSRLNAEYNTLDETELFDESGKPIYSAYEQRLIIRSDDTVASDRAVDSAACEGCTVLQYSSDDDLCADYEKFKSDGYSVAKDDVSFISGAEYEANSASDNSDTESTAEKYYYESNNIDYIKQIITDGGKSYGDVIVGVLDTGVEYTHELLADRMERTTGADFSSSGNGSIEDKIGHGTGVAGIIVQHTPENVKIRAYRLTDKSYIYLSQEIAAFEYILAEKDKPDIINMSFGGYDLCGDETKIVNGYIEKIVKSGITVCTAAGNDSALTEYSAPGGSPYTVNTASHDSNGNFSSFSDFGSGVDVCTFGEKIYTSALGNTYSSSDSGTSYASPFTAAACAYVLTQNPDYTPEQVKEKVISAAVNQGEDDTYYYGNGILNYADLLNDTEYEVPAPSIESRTYSGEQSVAFDVPDGTTLYYSTGHTVPTPNSKEYTEPITISENTVLHYVLVKDGKYVSRTGTSEYKIKYYADKSDFKVTLGMIREYTGDKKNIVVPDSISATAVYASAFYGSDITDIELPDKITTLGTSAFENCKSLKHITANGVTRFSGDSVFKDCSELRGETMPNLKTVTESAFEGCSKLREIDFGENITSLKSSLFKDSGLTSIDLPNAKISSTSNNDVFYGALLYTINIPKISEIGVNFLHSNIFLYSLKSAEIKTLRSCGLYGCQFLENYDISTITKLYANGLSGCYIKNFYAPNITGLESSGTTLGVVCRCEKIDLPNYTADLADNALLRATVKELYLDKVENMTENSLKNMPSLKTVYMPSVKAFYCPKVINETADTAYAMLGTEFRKYPHFETLWLPSAESIANLIAYGNEFVYAPSAETAEITINSASLSPVLVVADAANANGITVTQGTNGGAKPIITAHQSSACNAQSDSYTFAAIKNYSYSEAADGKFTYSVNGVEFKIPIEFISGEWKTTLINKDTENADYMFMFDFVSDKTINAKDYSVFARNKI